MGLIRLSSCRCSRPRRARTYARMTVMATVRVGCRLSGSSEVGGDPTPWCLPGTRPLFPSSHPLLQMATHSYKPTRPHTLPSLTMAPGVVRPLGLAAAAPELVPHISFSWLVLFRVVSEYKSFPPSLFPPPFRFGYLPDLWSLPRLCALSLST